MVVQGAIATHRADSLIPHLTATMHAACAHIDAEAGGEIDLHALLSKVLVDAFGAFALGLELRMLEGHNAPLIEAMLTISEALGERNATAAMPWLWSVPTRRNRQVAAARRTARSFIADVIAERRAAARRGPGDESHAYSESNLLERLLAKAEEGSMSDEMVLANLGLFFLASFENTANQLAFTLHLLARHPDTQAKLRAELSSLGGSAAPVESVLSAPFLDVVLKESMRCMPTAVGIARTTKSSVALDTPSGRVVLPPNTMCLLHVREMNHRSELWPEHPSDLKAFRPERWFAIEQPTLKHMHMPFGAGGRMCPGGRIAMMEMKVILALLVRQYHIQETRPLTVGLTLALAPENGAWFKLKRC